MPANKRYQIFVSSTFRDLNAQRQLAVKALLQMGAIPAGMELFPASDDTAWELIKRVIDECDYYVVIVGGRYGSTDAMGISFTEREYDYAVEQGKPVLAFLHRDPGELRLKDVDTDPTILERLEEFRTKTKARLVGEWANDTELIALVFSSVLELQQTRPSAGWIRGDQIPAETLEELASLREELSSLKSELARVEARPPAGSEQFSRDEDSYVVTYSVLGRDDPSERIRRISSTSLMTWNEIFRLLGPHMVVEAPESKLRQHLSLHIRDQVATDTSATSLNLASLRVEEQSFQAIKVQLIALGLVAASERRHAVTDSETYLSLTPLGATELIRLSAIRRPEAASPS